MSLFISARWSGALRWSGVFLCVRLVTLVISLVLSGLPLLLPSPLRLRLRDGVRTSHGSGEGGYLYFDSEERKNRLYERNVYSTLRE